MVFSFPDDLWSCDIKRFHSPHGTNLPWPDTKLYEYLLYGDVMTSSSAEGNTAVVNRYTSGYSSSISSRTLVPTPDPVPVNNGKGGGGGDMESSYYTSQCPHQIKSQAYVILLPYARLNNGKLLKSWCQHQGL